VEQLIVNNVVIVPFKGSIEHVPFIGGELIIKLIKPILCIDPNE